MSAFNPMLLIAVPQLADPNFKKSVVLMLHQDREGAFGLVLNDLMTINLLHFSKDQKLDCHPDIHNLPVLCGGPVEPYRGWLLHTSKILSEKQEVFPGTYVSGSNDSLKICLEKGVQPLRFILGYAGWGEGQLKKEMEEGSWITAPVESKYVFYDNPEGLWDLILKDMGVDPVNLALGRGMH